MKYAIDTDGVFHDAGMTLDGNRVVTNCQKVLKNAVMSDEGAVDCPGCLKPDSLVTVVPARPRRSRKPMHRPGRDSLREARENLQHAHKAVVAALEWLQRGDDLQFVEQVLDQTHLGYRFLGELLVKHHRIEPPEDVEDTE